MASLAENRARLQSAELGKTGAFIGDSAIYPHWNIDEGSIAKIRFLPNDNEKILFSVSNQPIVKLPFNRIKSEADAKQVEVHVPYAKMCNEACPILAEIYTGFKDPSLM